MFLRPSVSRSVHNGGAVKERLHEGGSVKGGRCCEKGDSVKVGCCEGGCREGGAMNGRCHEGTPFPFVVNKWAGRIPHLVVK